MKIITLIILILIVIYSSIYYLPSIRIKSYENEVDSLAFSYRVYKSNICPNRQILSNIRDDYIKTVDIENVSKLSWVNDNFDSRFMNTCLELNPHNGER